MSIYLESFLDMFPNLKYSFTEDDIKKDPGWLKSTYTNALRAHVWQKQEFIKLTPEAGPIDTNEYPSSIASHSDHKCPVEYAETLELPAMK